MFFCKQCFSCFLFGKVFLWRVKLPKYDGVFAACIFLLTYVYVCYYNVTILTVIKAENVLGPLTIVQVNIYGRPPTAYLHRFCSRKKKFSDFYSPGGDKTPPVKLQIVCIYTQNVYVLADCLVDQRDVHFMCANGPLVFLLFSVTRDQKQCVFAWLSVINQLQQIICLLVFALLAINSRLQVSICVIETGSRHLVHRSVICVSMLEIGAESQQEVHCAITFCLIIAVNHCPAFNTFLDFAYSMSRKAYQCSLVSNMLKLYFQAYNCLKHSNLNLPFIFTKDGTV